MAFNVRINFVGLLHFVQNTASDRLPFKLGIVLPSFPQHRGVLRSTAAIFAPHGGGAPQSEIPINGQRVFLRFLRSSGNPDYSYSENQVTTNLKGLVTFEAIAGDFGPQSGNVVAIQPRGPVEAQVFLQEGRFGVVDSPTTSFRWELPSGLVSRDGEAFISTRFFADVTSVDSLQVVVAPIRGGARARLFTVRANTPVEMTLSHSCGDRPRMDPPPRPFLFRVEDFIAHYRLLDRGTQERIADRVGGLDRAPVPQREVIPTAAKDRFSDPLGGCNCLGCATADQFFDVEGAFASALDQATDL